MSVTKLAPQDFEIKKCHCCFVKFTKAMMIQIDTSKKKFMCLYCYNGEKTNEKITYRFYTNN